MPRADEVIACRVPKPVAVALRQLARDDDRLLGQWLRHKLTALAERERLADAPAKGAER